MTSIKKINDKMYSLSKPKFICTIVIFTFIVSVIFIPINIIYEKYIGPMGGPATNNLTIVFIGSTILAPLFETFIYQMCVIKLFSLSKKIKSKKWLLIIISAMFFGSSHYYSIVYVIWAFIIGIFLAYSFIVYKDKEDSGFLVTAIIHSLMNLISFISLILN